MRGREVAIVAVALTLLNTLMLYSSSWMGLMASMGIIASWLLIGVAGYVAGRSHEPTLLVLEAAAIILLRLINTPALVSKSYVFQALGASLVIYVIGLAGGLLSTRGSGGYERKLNVSWDRFLPIVIGSTGASLISRFIVRTITILSIKSAGVFSLDTLRSPYVIISIIIFSLTYSVLASISYLSMWKSLVIAGVISFALPLSLPLAIIPQATSVVESGLLKASRKCVEIGILSKILIRGKNCRDPCFEFRVGENNHLMITGSSGTGKTTIAKILASKSSKLGINVLILDIHGEYRNLPGSVVISPVRHPINLLSLMGKSPSIRAEEVADLIASAYRLGNVQKAALHHLIMYAYKIYTAPTIKELIEIASDPRASEYLGFSKDVIRSLLPYLRSLMGIESSEAWLDPSTIARGLTVVDLSEVESNSLQQVYAESLLDSIFIFQRTSPAPLIIIIEEAHRFTGRSNSILMRLFREGRKFGINVAVITQEPYSLDPSIINNCGGIISTQLTESRAAAHISRMISGGNQKVFKKIRSILTNLNKLEAILWTREGCLYLIKVEGFD